MSYESHTPSLDRLDEMDITYQSFASFGEGVEDRDFELVTNRKVTSTRLGRLACVAAASTAKLKAWQSNAADRVLEYCTDRLTAADRTLTIHDRATGETVASRYYLLFKDKSEPDQPSRKLPFNLFLHHFQQSDTEPLHDHPWRYVSLVIKGGYWDVSAENRRWRGPGSLAHRPANWLHRVELDEEGGDCWTLAYRGPRTREWGYRDQGTSVSWREHLGYTDPDAASDQDHI